MKWFCTVLNERAERLRAESVRLAADHRRDEGDLTKIRANVYGICKSVYQVLGEDKARAKLDELRNTWKVAQAAAREHDDLKKAAIESIKLETLDEILELLNGKEM